MKLVKGMIIGGMVSAGLVLMYGETIGFNKNKMMKQIIIPMELIKVFQDYIIL